MSEQANNHPSAVAVNLQFQVPATTVWFDTGAYSDGSTAMVVEYVSGQWTANPENNQMVGPNGISTYIARPGYNYPGIYEGALVGKIDQTVFAIGDTITQMPTGCKGNLLLSINDDMSAAYGVGFTDNVGALTVQVWTPSTSDGQITGTSEEPLTTGNDDAPYSIVDSNDDIWVFWHHSNNGGTAYIRYKRYSRARGQWEPDVSLPTAPDARPDRFPVAVPSSDGDIWLFWRRGSGGNNAIYWDYYDAAAKAWQGNRQLSDNGETNNYYLSAVQGSSGDIWLFWTRASAGSGQVIASDHYDAATKTWQGNHQLNNRGYDPSAAWDSIEGEHIWVFYQGGDQFTNLYWNRYDLITNSWSGEGPLDQNVAAAINPCSVVDSKGALWVFWLTNRSGVSDIWYKCASQDGNFSNSATPLTRIAISNGYFPYYQTRSFLSAFADSRGGIWVFFGKDGSLFYKHYTQDTGWGSSVQFTVGKENGYPTAIEDSDGNIWVFWSKGTSDYRHLRYRKFSTSS